MSERNYEDECGDHGGRTKDGEPCGLAAGWGTPNDSGRCRHCLGTSADGSSHEANGNAETHALTADPKKYHARQPDAEKEWIRDLSATIEDRIRTVRGDVDPLDRVLARRVAIKLHIASTASEHVSKEGIMQTVQVEKNGATYEKEIPNAATGMLRKHDREIWSELQKLGLIDDPQSQQADATQDVFTLLAEEMHGDG